MTPALSPETLARAARAWRDGASLRVVGRARVTVGHADQAWSAQQALEDGLNSADFADCGRLIVVRRLQVRAPAGSGPAAGWNVARAIEAAWRALAPSVVAFDHPAAETAPAVYFESPTHARLAWLQAAAESRPVGAWFWRQALGDLATAAPISEASLALVQRLTREAPHALAQALRGWPAASVRRLVAAWPRPLPLALTHWPDAALRAAVAAAMPLATGDLLAPRTAEFASATGLAETLPLAAWLATLELQDDAALAWLAALMQATNGMGANVSATPSLDVVARVVAQAQVQVQALTVQRRGDADALSSQPARQLHQATAPSAPHAPSPAPSASTTATAPRATAAVQVPTLPAQTAQVPTTPPATPSFLNVRQRPWLAGSTPSTHGGLLMLLNVLRVMHFDAWLALQPAARRAPLVALLFDTIATRLRLPQSDPHRALFAAAQALAADAPAAHAIAHWLRRLRRVLRLQARIGLASLACREAGIGITATHIDVLLPLHATDLRLRRAGLDSNPGWLQWFGWIVTLHYIEADRR